MNLDEFKVGLRKYKKEDIEFGKSLDFLLSRLKTTKDKIEGEILNCDKLSFIEEQSKDNETRYALFFIYDKRKGREYVITFRNNKLRIITIFPLGRKTLIKYRKKGLNMKKY